MIEYVGGEGTFDDQNGTIVIDENIEKIRGAGERMGVRTVGVGAGRVDRWDPEEDMYGGSEKESVDVKRDSGKRD